MDRNGINFWIQKDAPQVYVRAFNAMLVPQPHWYPSVSEGTDSVGGQMRGNNDNSSYKALFPNTSSTHCVVQLDKNHTDIHFSKLIIKYSI